MKITSQTDCPSPITPPRECQSRTADTAMRSPGLEQFTRNALSYALKLYRNTLEGSLLIQIPIDERKLYQRSPIAFVTEHRPFECRQHTIRFDGQAETSTILPVGEYTIVISVKGCEPFRTFVTISEHQVTQVDATFADLNSQEFTFEDVLKKNRIWRDPKSLRSLTVEAGETVTLDPKAPHDGMDLEHVPLRTLEDVKQVLGTPDSAFVGDFPRFGRFAPRDPGSDALLAENLTVGQRAALHEYVYGNSRSVAGWAGALDKWIAQEEISFPIWALLDIDVGPHGILVITSSGVICNKLSVHYTAQVRFKGPGPIKLEMNHYLKYGFRTIDVVSAAIPSAKTSVRPTKSALAAAEKISI